MPRILAVDDDAAMEAFYMALFTDAGYEVMTAPDAGTAMEMYYDFKPDLIVLDADMPAGGGERVFNTARKVLGGEVPNIFVTGLPERVIDFALTHTRVRVFRKPVRSEDLLSTAASMLGT